MSQVTKSVVVLAFLSVVPLPSVHADASELLAHWPLSGDTQDASPNGNHGRAQGIDLAATGLQGESRGAALFDGRRSLIEVADSRSLKLGTGPFSISMWVHTEARLDDVLGDLMSKYDSESRRGFHLAILNAAGVTSAQSNYRHVQFGIDAGASDLEWTDCGRPGNCLLAFALCVFDGNLYAGTFEHGQDEAGHVYRYDGASKWTDCGSPGECNSVQALAVYNGRLYAGTGRYLAVGSALPESPNEKPGGKVYRYDGGARWVDCGQLVNAAEGAAFTVGGMAVYQGELYAGVSKHPGKGLYKYLGGSQWEYCGNPGHRVTNPVVYNGKMYFCSLDGGGVTRYDGAGSWADVGKPEGVTQTYGFAVHEGNLYASSWPNGEVFRYGGERQWTNAGRLGQEKEVMGMMVYNGELYAGTLPLAEVYRYDGDHRWLRTGRLDATPNVKYRRAWSMAVHNGKLYCGVLPSGRIHSLEAGKSVTWDHALPAGWVHLAAVKDIDELRLYVNGRPAASSTPLDGAAYDLSNNQPLQIGFGAHDYFNGKLKDVRVYGHALTPAQIAELASR